MAYRIEERFTVKAPAERVWDYLVDPRRVATCLPGAELTEVVDDRTFQGNVTVKVGPMTVPYRGRVHLAEVDAASRRVKMAAEGRESAGAGAARMTMESRLAALPDGGTEVVIQAEVDVAGRLVQLGRGMIPQISHQLFQQFAECARRTLEAEAAPGAAAAPLAAKAEPLRAIPLLLRALWAELVRVLQRLFGTKGR